VRRQCVSEVRAVIHRPQKFPIKCGAVKEGDPPGPRTAACGYVCMLLLLAPLRTRYKVRGVSQMRHVRLGVKVGALLADQSVVHSHFGEILDGHGTVILSQPRDNDGQGVRTPCRHGITKRMALTTERNERPMARNTLLFASSGCSITWDGGKAGMSWASWGWSEEMTLSFGVGTGFMRLGGTGGSGDCRRRAEGLMKEF
jgi:hypothetical protein